MKLFGRETRTTHGSGDLGDAGGSGQEGERGSHFEVFCLFGCIANAIVCSCLDTKKESWFVLRGGGSKVTNDFVPKKRELFAQKTKNEIRKEA